MRAVITALFVFLPLATPAFAQEPDEVADAIASLDKAIKEKAKPDIKHFAGLVGDKFANAKPDQQKEIFKLLGVAVGNSDQEIKDAVIEAVAKTADARGVPIIIKELDKKTTEDNAVYMGACIRALGKLKDPKAGLQRLLKLLKHKSNEIVSDAAGALGEYKDAAIDVKKTIFEDVLKIYGSLASAANNARDTTAKTKLQQFQPPADETLRTLSGQTHTGHSEWLKWWNDSGKKATKW